MKTTILYTITIGLFIFTVSAFSYLFMNNKIEILPFAFLGLILLGIFKHQLRLNSIKVK